MRWRDTVTIEAPEEILWALTINISDWPSITPTMQRVERLDSGPLRTGSTARVKQPGQSSTVWTVTRLTPHREFTWQSRRIGLTMTASHLIEDQGERCQQTLAIDLSGLGSRPVGVLIGGAIRKALHTENQGFKARAERLP